MYMCYTYFSQMTKTSFSVKLSEKLLKIIKEKEILTQIIFLLFGRKEEKMSLIFESL